MTWSVGASAQVEALPAEDEEAIVEDFVLRPAEPTTTEYELLYQTFIGQPTPSLQMRARIRVTTHEDEGYRAEYLSLERFEPFPSPGDWKRITIDPVLEPGGNEPPGVDVVIEHSGAPTMHDVLPPDIPAFSYTVACQTMMVLHLVDGTLALDDLDEVGASITLAPYTFHWDYGRYVRLQRTDVPESELLVESARDGKTYLRWVPGTIRTDRLVGFDDKEMFLNAMDETLEWVLEIDSSTGELLNAQTVTDTMIAKPAGTTDIVALPEVLAWPEEGDEYRTDRVMYLTKIE
jgi:hypothetical protein